eukprot:1370570-Amorphochlora_amoeboformis.AAC.1
MDNLKQRYNISKNFEIISYTATRATQMRMPSTSLGYDAIECISSYAEMRIDIYFHVSDTSSIIPVISFEYEYPPPTAADKLKYNMYVFLNFATLGWRKRTGLGKNVYIHPSSQNAA